VPKADEYKPDMSHLPEESQRKDRETDKTLDKLSGILDDIKIGAEDIGLEIDRQNAQMKIIEERSSRVSIKAERQTRRVIGAEKD